MQHAQLKPGVLLRGKWTLDKFLGRGGMSSVYSATHRNGMRGAIKVLHRELNDNDVVKRRFMREGYVANKVEHPGAVSVLDDDVTEDGLVFLVMELLEGVTLKRRWIESDRRMDPATVCEIADQILDVLESAHRNKIVHRDLKPDNIFLLANGAVKVLDFGIARVLEATIAGSADATSSAAMMGTPAFMPPEQALAHWNKVDGRSDLFALAATAYTVLTGKLIHSGSTMPELLIAAATRQVDPIRAVMPELDESLAAVIDRALRFEIGERWPDARAMRLALLQAKTQTAGNRTVKLQLLSPEHAEALAGASASAVSARNGADPLPAEAIETAVPSTTPLDASDNPTVAYAPALPSPGVGSPQVRGVERPLARTVPLPAQARANARTLHSDTAGDPGTSFDTVDGGPPSSSAWDATPVRLQQPMRPEHVARLAKISTGQTEAGARNNKAWLTWLMAAVTAAAVLVVAVVVRPGGGTPSATKGAAASVGDASSAPSSPAPEPPRVVAQSSDDRLRPVLSGASISSATQSASASAASPPTASAAPLHVPLPTGRKPVTRPCKEHSEFDGTCIRR